MLAVSKFRHLQIFYRKGTADDKVLAHSFDNDIFYPELYDLKRKPGMVIIDIGAHIGTFSILSAMNLKCSKVISVEPNPETFKILKKNIGYNKIDNVYTEEAALTNKQGPIKLFLSDENWEHSITKNFQKKSVTVQGITLPLLFEKHLIDACDLIKMNCEGAEFKVLFNAPPALMLRIKMMLILFHEDLVEKDYSRAALVGFLKNNNFLVRAFNLTKDRGWIVAKNKNHYNNIGHYFGKLSRWVIK